MRRVYAAATRVIAWLGDKRDHSGDEGAGKDLAVIELLAADGNIHWNDSKVDFADIFSVGTWFHSAWWSRVWTAQEAVVARSLVFLLMDVEIPGEMLRKFFRNFDNHANLVQCCNANPSGVAIHISGFLHLGSHRLLTLNRFRGRLERQDRGGRSISLSSAAAMGRSRNATDPRDKVYAFLGLSRGFQTNWVDYTLGIEPTYEAAARQCIISTGRLDVLFFCHFCDQTSSIHPDSSATSCSSPLKLPSWVPDWTRQYEWRAEIYALGREDIIDHWAACDGLQMWQACGATLCRAVVSGQDPPGHLGVSGYCFDTTATLAEPQIEPDQRNLEAIHTWRAVSGVDRDPMSPYIGGGSRLRAYRRTLCMNTSIVPAPDRHAAAMGGRDRTAYDTRYAAATDERDDAAHDMWWFKEMCRNRRAMEGPDGDPPIERLYRSNFLACAFGRGFFISKTGYFGLAPSTAQSGDQICILEGGRMPFILREAGQAVLPDSGTVKAFKLIGDSYVHGIMHGEAITDVEEGRASLQRWALI